MENPFKLVKPEVYEERIKICRACPHVLQPLNVDQCGICKCIMAVKARMAIMRCPDSPTCGLEGCAHVPRWGTASHEETDHDTPEPDKG